MPASKLPKLIAPLVIGLVGLGYFGWTYAAAPTAPTAPITSPVRLGTVSQTVLASGMLEARELVSVGARVSGQIETLAVDLGDFVKAGDLIAEIDSQDQRNDVLKAEAALLNTKAQISAKMANQRRAELALQRAKSLGAQRLSTQEAVEQAEAEVAIQAADLEALQAQLSTAELGLATAKTALERTRITAPIDGTVVAIVVKQGQTVNANNAAPTIVKLADLATMIVKAEISEADVMNVRPGQAANFTTLGAPLRPFDARLTSIEPAPSAIGNDDVISSETAIYYNGLLEVDNPEGQLRIGMTAQVAIELGRAENVLTVPFSALKREGRERFVEVYDPQTGATERRPVEVGLDNKVLAEIRSGLAEGDAVITGAAGAGRGGARGPGRMGPMGF